MFLLTRIDVPGPECPRAHIQAERARGDGVFGNLTGIPLEKSWRNQQPEEEQLKGAPGIRHDEGGALAGPSTPLQRHTWDVRMSANGLSYLSSGENANSSLLTPSSEGGFTGVTNLARTSSAWPVGSPTVN